MVALVVRARRQERAFFRSRRSGSVATTSVLYLARERPKEGLKRARRHHISLPCGGDSPRCRAVLQRTWDSTLGSNDLMHRSAASTTAASHIHRGTASRYAGTRLRSLAVHGCMLA